jgi:hypothetical protein
MRSGGSSPNPSVLIESYANLALGTMVANSQVWRTATEPVVGTWFQEKQPWKARQRLPTMLLGWEMVDFMWLLVFFLVFSDVLSHNSRTCCGYIVSGGKNCDKKHVKDSQHKNVVWLRNGWFHVPTNGWSQTVEASCEFLVFSEVWHTVTEPAVGTSFLGKQWRKSFIDDWCWSGFHKNSPKKHSAQRRLCGGGSALNCEMWEENLKQKKLLDMTWSCNTFDGK